MKINLKKWIYLIIILIISMAVISCGKEDVITIGLSSSLSGANSDVGVSIRDGFLLKVEEVNASGGINGRMVEVIIRDDGNDLEKVKEIDREFIELGVDVIFGHELSFKAISILEETRGEDVLVLSPTISTSKISGINDNFIRTMASNFDQGVTIAEYSKDKNEKMMIVYDAKNSEFASGMIKGFSSVFGDNMTIFAIHDDMKNSEEQILELYKNEEFDGVFCVTNPNDVIYLSQIFYKNEMNVDIYSSSWGLAMNALKNGEKAVEAVAYITMLDSNKSEKYVEFRNEYFHKYKKEPEFPSAYSYEAAIFLFDSLEKLDEVNYREIKRVMLNAGEQSGIISEYTVNKYGDVIRELYITVVKNGKLEIQ